MKKKNNEPEMTYKQYLKVFKKSEKERCEEDKPKWRYCIKDNKLLQDMAPIQKSEFWLRQIMTKGNLDANIDDVEFWETQITDNELEDQESLVYFVSRGVDCSIYIQNLNSRFKQKKLKSEKFTKLIESLPNNQLRLLGLRRHKSPRKFNEEFTMRDAAWRSTRTVVNDDESHLIASMFRTIEWCDIGGFDDILDSYLSGLREDIARGDEVDQELASQFLFYICRSDLAVEIMGENLIKLLDIVERPDYQLTTPWHRWNHDQSLMMFRGGIEINSIYAYAASLAFANKRLRQYNLNKEIVNQSTKWLLESQGEDGSWKTSTLLDEPSILTTCMAVHALALNKPRGWKLAVAQACDWLLKKQDKFGFWYESPFCLVDPVHLTVLVLDTMALVKGEMLITFRADKEFTNLENYTASSNIFQTFYTGEVTMGDKYNIGDNKGGIQNIGKFKNVTSKVTLSENKEFIDKLMALMDAVKNSQNLSGAEKDEHIEVIEQLHKELAKPQPNKTMLKMLGDGLLKTLQIVPDLVKVAAAIAPYLNNLPK